MRPPRELAQEESSMFMLASEMDLGETERRTSNVGRAGWTPQDKGGPPSRAAAEAAWEGRWASRAARRGRPDDS